MTTPRVLFAGTPAFALASLAALVDSGVEPVAVLTQPDRPAGRGKKLTASPVKQYAAERNIEVLQPRTLRDDTMARQLANRQPDIMVVAAYGLILPQAVLDIPSQGCVNVHASLLPRWRGAAPIQAALLAGDEHTGISLMSMTAGLDCGPVYLEKSLRIGRAETAGELHDRLAELGGRVLADNLPAIFNGELEAVEQDEAQASYAGKIARQDARLDWTLPAAQLERQVRAYNPVPGAWFEYGGASIKCWVAECADAVPAAPGTVVASGADGIVVACGEGCLSLLALQRPGKRRITARDFAAQLDLSGQRLP